MCSIAQLDNYMDGLESLPKELQKNFSSMRDLDSKVQALLKQIERDTNEYLDHAAKFPPSRRREAKERISKMYVRAKALAEDKVQLAMSTYETVDKHIRRLDTELARFENEFKEKLLSKSGAALVGFAGVPAIGGEKRKRGEGRRKTGDAVSTAAHGSGGSGSGGTGGSSGPTTPGPGRQRKRSRNAAVHDLFFDSDPMLLPSLQSMTNGGDMMDMPVDPNEPTYCLCHQVSYGEMIGCDNPDCPIEWFHFACVGLSTKPKGKWFCPKCGPPLGGADKKKK